jgi:hypothetical protein
LAACGASHDAPAPPEDPGLDGLAAYLAAAAHDPARAVDTWTLSPNPWRATVVDPYTDHRDDYVAALAARKDELAHALAHYHGAAPRAHFADDPQLSLGQVHVRWMLPPVAPAGVVDGIDAVFVHDGTGWRALVDLDDTIAAKLSPDCAAAYRARAPKSCQEWAFEIAEGVLRGDGARTQRACAQAIALKCTM